jgi:hypothetical protein
VWLTFKYADGGFPGGWSKWGKTKFSIFFGCWLLFVIYDYELFNTNFFIYYIILYLNSLSNNNSNGHFNQTYNMTN